MSLTQTRDNTIIYRASALGSCPRALLASRRDLSPVPNTAIQQRAYDEGIAAEPIIIESLKSKLTIVQEQREVTLHIADNIFVIGHVDGLVANFNPNPVTASSPVYPLLPLEVKAFAQSTYDTWIRSKLSAFPSYAWQISCYCAALHVTHALFAIHNKATSKTKLFLLRAPYTPDQINSRILAIESLIPNQDSWPPCERTGFLCPYPYLHESTPVEPVSDPHLDSLLEAYHRAQLGKAAIETLLKDSRQEILDYLESKSLTTGATPHYKFSATTVSTNRFNRQALEDYLETTNSSSTYDSFLAQTSYTRLTVDAIL